MISVLALLSKHGPSVQPIARISRGIVRQLSSPNALCGRWHAGLSIQLWIQYRWNQTNVVGHRVASNMRDLTEVVLSVRTRQTNGIQLHIPFSGVALWTSTRLRLR